MSSLRILYRADGGHPIGTGHIFRGVRILQALARKAELDAVVMFADDPFARRVLDATPFRQVVLPPRHDPGAVKPRLYSAPVLTELAVGAYDLVCVDMLDTPEADMAAIAASNVPLITFDDRGSGRRYADILINVLVEEPEPAFLCPETRLLEGGDYVVLDDVFDPANRRNPPRDMGSLRKVFVAMGGADAAGLTVKVADALRRLPALERVEFVCGPAFPHRSALDTLLRDAPWPYHVHAGLPSLLDRYYWCDLAVVAGGLTMYEVCCTGTPALAVCQPIDHQLELADRLASHGAMATVGYGLDASVEQIAGALNRLAEDAATRQRMAEQGPALADGKGTQRVADALLEIAGARH